MLHEIMYEDDLVFISDIIIADVIKNYSWKSAREDKSVKVNLT